MLRKSGISIASIFLVLSATSTPAQIATELAGNPLSQYPHFEYVRAFNANAPVSVAIDPTRFPSVAGQTCDVYVTAPKTAAQWTADPTLTDLRPGGSQTVAFTGATIQANTVQVAVAGALSADAGAGLGVGYDVVLDCDQNGILGAADVIDGLGDEAGLYRVHDTTAPGPLAVTSLDYALDSADGTTFGIPGTKLAQKVYYPSNISSLGQLPLVIIGRGNGHKYFWYDHIGNHMASYGYIVMSHANNTEPGTQAAADTTLRHTDAFIDLASAGAIASGDLVGHIDANRIVWIGHSRGAEGVAIAYERLVNGSYTPTNYTRSAIKLISSMLPTDFYGSGVTPGGGPNAPINGIANPNEANFHLWTAAGDSDVNGSASCPQCQTFHIHDRATAYRQSTVVQGTGHGWFHAGHDVPLTDGGTTNDAFTGPCSIGGIAGTPASQRNDLTHQIQLGHFLPLILHYVEGNVPALDFLTRQYERFRPIGVTTSNSCVVVTHEYRNASPLGNFVIDDYQTQPSDGISSSGAQVLFDVENVTEGRLDDNDTTFGWMTSGSGDPLDPFNGATQAHTTDTSRGVVFDWTNQDRFYEWEVAAGRRDFTAHTYLSFRGAQGTQHPNTLADPNDLTFTVTLRDLDGDTSSINIGAYGGGLEQPYDRSGGWHNEMETVRIRLTDFLNNGSNLELSNVVAVRLNVGPTWGSAQGRVVIDDVMLTNDVRPGAPAIPVLRVSEVVLDYGEVELGFAFSKAVVLHNDGTAPLAVSLDLTTPIGDPNLVHWSEINEIGSTTIAPGDPPLILRQTYEPQGLGNHLIQMQVTSNDPGAMTVPVTLIGEGVTPIPVDSMLVLDRSGSMSDPAGDRIKIEALRDAAMLYTDLQRPDIGGTGFGDKLGFWKYNHQNSQYLALDFVSAGTGAAIAANDLSAAALTDSARLRPSGNTGIGGAMENAATAIGGSLTDRKQVMVVLTDGKENVAPFILNVLGGIQTDNPDLQIYSVGLGSNIEAGKLQSITNMGTEGYHQVSDALTGESLFELESFYFKIFSNATGMDLVVDPTHVIDLRTTDPIVVDTARIVSSDRNANFLVLDDPALRPFYDLEFVSPTGTVMVPGVTIGGIPIQETRRGTYRIYRIVFPDVSQAASYVGDWVLRLTPNGKWNRRTVKQALAESQIEHSSFIDPNQGLVPVGFAAAVSSTYRLAVSTQPDRFLPGATVRLEARLTDRGWPMPMGQVNVLVTDPDDATHSLTLFDDGTHGDTTAGDAVWTNSFSSTARAGVYRFLFRSTGQNERGELAPREASRFVTLAPVEPTPTDDPGGPGAGGGGNSVASYLIGSYDLREGRTHIHVMNPTGEVLNILVALFTVDGKPQRCIDRKVPPNGLFELPVDDLDPKTLLGVVKVVSLDPRDQVPKHGVVGNQRIRYERGAVSETGLHPVSDRILQGDLKRILSACR